MASMSGLAYPSSPGGPRPDGGSRGPLEDDLFGGLVVSNPAAARRSYGLPVSVAAHIVTLALVVLVPIFWPEAPPEHPDYIRALFYNPPAAAAAPLPKGTGIVKPERAKPVTPDPHPETPKMTVEVPRDEKPLKPEARAPETEQAGSPTGSDAGIPEGMEGGVDGGVPGGVLGGTPGGCVGCTGDSPVTDYDQGPRPIKMVKPEPYPQEAFVKKIEGIVSVEVLIDVTGRVAQARVVRSIPSLDEAARQAALQWLFSPAMKHGRPVPSVATLQITFRIY